MDSSLCPCLSLSLSLSLQRIVVYLCIRDVVRCYTVNSSLRSAAARDLRSIESPLDILDEREMSVSRCLHLFVPHKGLPMRQEVVQSCSMRAATCVHGILEICRAPPYSEMLPFPLFSLSISISIYLSIYLSVCMFFSPTPCRCAWGFSFPIRPATERIMTDRCVVGLRIYANLGVRHFLTIPSCRKNPNVCTPGPQNQQQQQYNIQLGGGRDSLLVGKAHQPPTIPGRTHLPPQAARISNIQRGGDKRVWRSPHQHLIIQGSLHRKNLGAHPPAVLRD